MRVPTSFASFVPLAAAALLAGCPGPSDDDWTADSCYCDDSGCYDYDNNACTPPTGGAASSSGRLPGSSSGSSGTPDGGSSGTTSSSSGDPDGGSSGVTSSSSGSGGVSSSSGGSTSSSGGPTPNCQVDTDCGGNQTCENGFCRFQCTTDDQCRSFDNRLTVCDNSICRQD